MAPRPVELHIGGQSYRVVSSASPEDLERLANVVDEKLTAILPPGKPLTPQSMLLVALALAHDLELAQRRTHQVRFRSKEAISTLLDDVDATLAVAEQTLGDARASSTAEASSTR